MIGGLSISVPQSSPLIAIVDDDESMRDAVKGLVRSLGYAAETFPSAREFLDSPHLAKTALLIADVNMPGMRGDELVGHLVAGGKSIPTILITAYPEEHVKARALTAGVSCYLKKPFAADELVSCIRDGLSARGPHGGKEHTAPP